LLLLDEPAQGLDAPLRLEFYDILRQVRGEFKTPLLLVTHDLDEALFLGDRIVLLSEGKLMAHLEPQEFLHSRQPEVEAYVHAFHRGELSAAAEKRA